MEAWKEVKVFSKKILLNTDLLELEVEILLLKPEASEMEWSEVQTFTDVGDMEIALPNAGRSR